MPKTFDATPEATAAIEKLADEIPGIQQTLTRNHKHLQSADRAAHQQQIAGGRVLLRIASALPSEIKGLGRPGSISRERRTGLGVRRDRSGLDGTWMSPSGNGSRLPRFDAGVPYAGRTANRLRRDQGTGQESCGPETCSGSSRSCRHTM